MCGGIICNLAQIPKKELEKRFKPEEIAKMEKQGNFESYFWSQQPLLPIEENGEIKLVDWGNRSKDIKLPQTGWAKSESIDAGKWAHLHPKLVKIPVDRGYEKGVWFSVDGSFKGVEVSDGETNRVYMITKPASTDYEKLTKHNREPVEWR